ncbi:MAG: DoxX family protein [Pseudonocardiaceae bacterium]
MSNISAASEPQAAPTATRGRALNVTLWVVQALLALFFALIGVLKLIGPQEVVDEFATIGLGQWFRYLTGALELAGGIGLLIPRLAGLAALGLAGVMVGAAITHLTVLPPATGALFPALLGVVFVLITGARWPQTRALFDRSQR